MSEERDAAVTEHLLATREAEQSRGEPSASCPQVTLSHDALRALPGLAINSLTPAAQLLLTVSHSHRQTHTHTHTLTLTQTVCHQ